MTTQGFPKLFHDYYAIHETIDLILKEGAPPVVEEIARRVREAHPDIGMGPATLLTAIRQAIKDQIVPSHDEQSAA